MTDQRRPDKGIVVANEQELAIGAGVCQLLRAREEMPQRALSSREHDRTSKEQRLFSERNNGLGAGRI